MNQNQLPAFLAVLVPRILSQLIENKNITEHEAIQVLYNSQLYATLEQEEAKLWHLSAQTLYAMLDEELSTGVITYPEEQ
ncbi:MAG: hypothetical protein FWD44_05900 [Oscillospiraceae bacterium]|nr:hypothetical protein [Oscillospiraceae bacterium]